MSETLNAINETLKHLSTNFVCFDVDRDREVNVAESLLDIQTSLDVMLLPLSHIQKKLDKIANALEKIANIFETKETRSFTLKVENCFDPSNGLFASQEPEEPEGLADMA